MMQPRIILLSCFVCWIVLLAQGGEGLFFTSGSAGVVIGGTTAAGGANAAVLLGGLVVAKAVGLGVLALLLSRRGRKKSSSRYSSGRSYRRYSGRYRGKREAGFPGDDDIEDIDENDILIIKNE